MKRAPLTYVLRRDETVPLVVSNMCSETIYPGIVTQSGTAPSVGGFELQTGQTQNLTVGADWQGRVWGRTNCSFNSAGTGPSNNGGYNGGGVACGTGDCGGIVNCKATGETPVSLAEFTLATSSGQTFYDISLVDGYNIPIAIVSLYPESGNSSLTDIPPNLTNPICIGTAALLASEGSTSDATGTSSGTNSSFPIPLEQSQSVSDVQRWCPWDLQLDPPSKPGDGVYPYPDDDIQRPIFSPCLSACAKYQHAADCCTGSYDNPKICKPSTYSQEAKKVCPDAYSYAFDDQSSTFIIPSGGGFEVVFCPTGRSSNILKVYSQQLFQLAATGHVSADMLADTQNITLQKVMIARTAPAKDNQVDKSMSPPLPKWRPRRTLIDLYTEKDKTSWYWRAAATFSAFLVMLGFLILGPASQINSSRTALIKSSVIAAIIILVVGYILSLVIAITCSSWVFQLDILYVPCLTSSLLGLINVLYSLSTHSAPPQWTSSAIASVVLSVVSTLVYTIAALFTFRKIHIVRARDAMHRYSPESSTDKMMPETELQRQQLLRLLLQQEDAKKQSPDNNQQTFKLDWPGNHDNRRNTMTTLRNLPRAARQAYENRSSASFMVQDPHPQAAMHMDPVTEEESLDPRMAPMRASAYIPPSDYDDHNIPGIVNTRYQPSTQAQIPTPAPPPLQANGYPIEKPEAQQANEPPLVERSYNQYHVIEEVEWQRQQDQEPRPMSTASRESRRLEIELADRGRGERRRQDLDGVEVIGSIRRVETDGWGRR